MGKLRVDQITDKVGTGAPQFTTGLQASSISVNTLRSPGGAGFVGTVSKTGESAIVERGSNANGEYVRFADGTQICTAYLVFADSGDTTWTYPAAFGTTAVRVVVQYEDANRGVGISCLITKSATDVIFCVLTSAGVRRGAIGYVVAIGRWF